MKHTTAYTVAIPFNFFLERVLSHTLSVMKITGKCGKKTRLGKTQTNVRFQDWKLSILFLCAYMFGLEWRKLHYDIYIRMLIF